MASFLKWQLANWADHDMIPPELPAQEAIHFLKDYLLGEKWYFVPPENAKRGNVYIVDAILYRYSRKYRNEIRKYYRQQKKRGK